MSGSTVARNTSNARGRNMAYLGGNEWVEGGGGRRKTPQPSYLAEPLPARPSPRSQVMNGAICRPATRDKAKRARQCEWWPRLESDVQRAARNSAGNPRSV